MKGRRDGLGSSTHTFPRRKANKRTSHGVAETQLMGLDNVRGASPCGSQPLRVPAPKAHYIITNFPRPLGERQPLLHILEAKRPTHFPAGTFPPPPVHEASGRHPCCRHHVSGGEAQGIRHKAASVCVSATPPPGRCPACCNSAILCRPPAGASRRGTTG